MSGAAAAAAVNAWQRAYESDTGRRGIVTRVWAEFDAAGGVGIWLEVVEGEQLVYYSPFYNPTPKSGHGSELGSDGNCLCDSCLIEADLELWLQMMAGAAKYEQWQPWETTRFH